MDKKQKDEKVLLVANKDDGGKLKVVVKAAAKDGILRLLLPSMERTGMSYFVKNVMKFLRELLYVSFLVLELMANPCNNRKIILSVQGFAN